MKCEICNNEFEPKKRASNSRYCSRKCKDKAYKLRKKNDSNLLVEDKLESFENLENFISEKIKEMGKILKEMRENKNLTHKDLFNKAIKRDLEINIPQMIRIESGENLRFQTFVNYCNVLDVPIILSEKK